MVSFLQISPPIFCVHFYMPHPYHRSWFHRPNSIRWGIHFWIHLAQDRVQWQTFVSTAVNLQGPQKAKKFLISLATVSFLRTPLFHDVSWLVSWCHRVMSLLQAVRRKVRSPHEDALLCVCVCVVYWRVLRSVRLAGYCVCLRFAFITGGNTYLVRRSKIIFWNVGIHVSEWGRSEASGNEYKRSVG